MEVPLNIIYTVLYYGLVPTKILSSLGLERIPVFVIMLVLVVTLWIPTHSYATDKSEKLRWEMIYLSPNGGCTNFQYEMANQYDEITSKYFDLYQFDNSKYPVKCMSDKKYVYYQPPKDLDLLILVYDNEIGIKELHGNNINGLYNHIGTDRTKDHTIIICDCSNFGFSDPNWDLSHELSHFITYYLGFGLSIVQDEIHSRDAKYDQCVETHIGNGTCANVKTVVYGDHYFTRATVMAPYQPAIGKKLIPTGNTTNSQDVVTNPQDVLLIQKEITKWWLAGKINDTDYTKVLSFMVGKIGGMPGYSSQLSDMILEDGPNGKKENATFFDMTKGKDTQDSEILKRIPFKENITDSSPTKIPSWFKTRAQLWTDNKSLTDNDFVTGVNAMFSTNYTDNPSIIPTPPLYTKQSNPISGIQPVHIDESFTLTLCAPSFNLNSTMPDYIPLDMVELRVMGGAHTTLEDEAFHLGKLAIKETGSDTGVFQVTFDVPKQVRGFAVEKGTIMEFRLTDLSETSQPPLRVFVKVDS